MNLETALAEFRSKSYFIWDDFLTPAEVALVAIDYKKIYRAGSFQLAGIGNGVRNLNAEIRSDESYWLDPLALTSSQSIFWNRLEKLKKSLNEALLLGLWSLDGQYSRYPIDGFYRKHIDRSTNDDQRTVSAVLYFNPEWVSGDGGELRIHGDASEKTDFAPLGGRLICFLSSKILHEVLASNKIRLSFAGWWKTRTI
jgi:SM-20-related protein